MHTRHNAHQDTMHFHPKGQEIGRKFRRATWRLSAVTLDAPAKALATNLLLLASVAFLFCPTTAHGPGALRARRPPRLNDYM